MTFEFKPAVFWPAFACAAVGSFVGSMAGHHYATANRNAAIACATRAPTIEAGKQCFEGRGIHVQWAKVKP